MQKLREFGNKVSTAASKAKATASAVVNHVTKSGRCIDEFIRNFFEIFTSGISEDEATIALVKYIKNNFDYSNARTIIKVMIDVSKSTAASTPTEDASASEEDANTSDTVISTDKKLSMEELLAQILRLNDENKKKILIELSSSRFGKSINRSFIKDFIVLANIIGWQLWKSEDILTFLTLFKEIEGFTIDDTFTEFLLNKSSIQSLWFDQSIILSEQDTSDTLNLFDIILRCGERNVLDIVLENTFLINKNEYRSYFAKWLIHMVFTNKYGCMERFDISNGHMLSIASVLNTQDYSIDDLDKFIKIITTESFFRHKSDYRFKLLALELFTSDIKFYVGEKSMADAVKAYKLPALFGSVNQDSQGEQKDFNMFILTRITNNLLQYIISADNPNDVECLIGYFDNVITSMFIEQIITLQTQGALQVQQERIPNLFDIFFDKAIRDISKEQDIIYSQLNLVKPLFELFLKFPQIDIFRKFSEMTSVNKAAKDFFHLVLQDAKYKVSIAEFFITNPNSIFLTAISEDDKYLALNSFIRCKKEYLNKSCLLRLIGLLKIQQAQLLEGKYVLVASFLALDDDDLIDDEFKSLCFDESCLDVVASKMSSDERFDFQHQFKKLNSLIRYLVQRSRSSDGILEDMSTKLANIVKFILQIKDTRLKIELISQAMSTDDAGFQQLARDCIKIKQISIEIKQIKISADELMMLLHQNADWFIANYQLNDIFELVRDKFDVGVVNRKLVEVILIFKETFKQTQESIDLNNFLNIQLGIGLTSIKNWSSDDLLELFKAFGDTFDDAIKQKIYEYCKSSLTNDFNLVLALFGETFCAFQKLSEECQTLVKFFEMASNTDEWLKAISIDLIIKLIENENGNAVSITDHNSALLIKMLKCIRERENETEVIERTVNLLKCIHTDTHELLAQILRNAGMNEDEIVECCRGLGFNYFDICDVISYDATSPAIVHDHVVKLLQDMPHGEKDGLLEYLTNHHETFPSIFIFTCEEISSLFQNSDFVLEEFFIVSALMKDDNERFNLFISVIQEAKVELHQLPQCFFDVISQTPKKIYEFIGAIATRQNIYALFEMILQNDVIQKSQEIKREIILVFVEKQNEIIFDSLSNNLLSAMKTIISLSSSDRDKQDEFVKTVMSKLHDEDGKQKFFDLLIQSHIEQQHLIDTFPGDRCKLFLHLINNLELQEDIISVATPFFDSAVSWDDQTQKITLLLLLIRENILIRDNAILMLDALFSNGFPTLQYSIDTAKEFEIDLTNCIMQFKTGSLEERIRVFEKFTKIFPKEIFSIKLFLDFFDDIDMSTSTPSLVIADAICGLLKSCVDIDNAESKAKIILVKKYQEKVLAFPDIFFTDEVETAMIQLLRNSDDATATTTYTLSANCFLQLPCVGRYDFETFSGIFFSLSIQNDEKLSILQTIIKNINGISMALEFTQKLFDALLGLDTELIKLTIFGDLPQSAQTYSNFMSLLGKCKSIDDEFLLRNMILANAEEAELLIKNLKAHDQIKITPELCFLVCDMLSKSGSFEYEHLEFLISKFGSYRQADTDFILDCFVLLPTLGRTNERFERLSSFWNDRFGKDFMVSNYQTPDAIKRLKSFNTICFVFNTFKPTCKVTLTIERFDDDVTITAIIKFLKANKNITIDLRTYKTILRKSAPVEFKNFLYLSNRLDSASQNRQEFYITLANYISTNINDLTIDDLNSLFEYFKDQKIKLSSIDLKVKLQMFYKYVSMKNESCQPIDFKIVLLLFGNEKIELTRYEVSFEECCNLFVEYLKNNNADNIATIIDLFFTQNEKSDIKSVCDSIIAKALSDGVSTTAALAILCAIENSFQESFNTYLAALIKTELSQEEKAIVVLCSVKHVTSTQNIFDVLQELRKNFCDLSENCVAELLHVIEPSAHMDDVISFIDSRQNKKISLANIIYIFNNLDESLRTTQNLNLMIRQYYDPSERLSEEQKLNLLNTIDSDSWDYETVELVHAKVNRALLQTVYTEPNVNNCHIKQIVDALTWSFGEMIKVIIIAVLGLLFNKKSFTSDSFARVDYKRNLIHEVDIFARQRANSSRSNAVEHEEI